MLFFELLQIAIGNKAKFSHVPTEMEWRELFVLAQRQAMVGIAFRGVEQLPDAQRPPKPLLMQWYMTTERIKVMNADLDHKALAVANKFIEEGFPGMILKGQGVAKLYRVEQIENSKLKIENCHPVGDARDDENKNQGIGELSIKEYRTPGDVDIWLLGERKDILRYVRSMIPDCKPVYHHVDFPVVDGVDIEVHFTPSWMNSPFTNRRLQRFFRSFVSQSSTHLTEPKAACHYEKLPVPDNSFNRVFILVHIYRHLFAEGVGLRQLLDYYFVLYQGFTAEEREDTMRVLRTLRMERFAGAVMWVLQRVYGMDDRYLLTTPDAEEGEFLLSEIMLAGNFGQYDDRLRHVQGESAVHWGWRKVKRNFRFVHSYPSEVLWSPLFKVWHWWWRRKHVL